MLQVVLCAGHHRARQGAVSSNGITEYQASLKVCSAAEDLLDTLHIRYALVLGNLPHKVAEVNRLNPALALDIHFNADYDHLDPNDLDNTRGQGCMVMYAPPEKSYADPRQDSLRRQQADTMSRDITTVLGNPNMGGRAGWYWGGVAAGGLPAKKDYFLTRTACPAFIPELGYIDNKGFEEEYLCPHGYDKLAMALVSGIRGFLSLDGVL